MPGQLKSNNFGPNAVMVSSKHCTDLQIGISLLLREEGSNKLTLQLGRLKKFDYHSLGSQTSGVPLFHKPSCSIERGGNQGGTVTHLFF